MLPWPSTGNRLIRGLCGTVAAALVAAGCAADPAAPTQPQVLVDVPPGFPEQIVPADNATTSDRVALGKMLFHSTQLSRFQDISCASCHLSQHAFAGNRPVSPGTGGAMGTRNAPSLANVGYYPHFMREGGVPTLEQQIAVPIQEHAEFDFNMVRAVDRLRTDTTVQRMAQAAYGRDLDAFVLTRAIAAYERTLVSGRSRADVGTLTPAEQRGKALFFSDRTSCSSCHSGFLYTTFGFANTGIHAAYTDPGRMRMTDATSDSNVFVIPSLRIVAVTAPYMHDGSYATLRDVIDNYNAGGHPHVNKAAAIRPLGLTRDECDDIEAFLRALTDETFITRSR
ncbi:MAG: cytochrome-c peroxidase [Candidatus Kapabacteria bacterium]|nr:cytochrome-c peroxidase [Candidatus Kapabacteria bacterium]